MVFILAAAANLLAITITAIISHVNNIVEPLLQIPYIEMSGTSYLITAIVILLLASIYLITYQTIDLVKKEGKQNEN